MAYGLPVIAQPIGGLANFFKNGVHGFISDGLDPKVFANLIEKLLIDKALYKTISLYNYQYAQSHFLASDAVSRLEMAYKTVLSNKLHFPRKLWRFLAPNEKYCPEVFFLVLHCGPKIAKNTIVFYSPL